MRCQPTLKICTRKRVAEPAGGDEKLRFWLSFDRGTGTSDSRLTKKGDPLIPSAQRGISRPELVGLLLIGAAGLFLFLLLK